MSEEPQEPMTIEDMFVKVFNELNEMKTEFGKAIEADRSQINKITESMNQLNAAVTAANTAKATNPNTSKKGGIKLGAGAQGLISMVTDLGKAFLANPSKFLGESKPEDAMYTQHKDLINKAFVANIENTMALGKLELSRKKAEIARIGKTGWGLR